MTRKIEMNESQYPNFLTMKFGENDNLVWQNNFTSRFVTALITSIPSYMKYKMQGTEKVSFKVSDFNGSFVFGSILTYEPGEEDEEDSKGSFNLQFTFNEEDFKEESGSSTVYDIMNNEFMQILEKKLWEINGGKFKNVDDAGKMLIVYRVLEYLHEFMKQNASEEEFTVFVDGILETTSIKEGDSIIVTILPGEVTKQQVKDDAVL